MKRITNGMEKEKGNNSFKVLKSKLDAQIPVIYRFNY